MFDYLNGIITELTPTYIVLDNNGVGYYIHISLHTYTALKVETKEKLFVHQIIREDAHLLFGFKTTQERDVFRLLVSVSGIGANTARMILSSMTPEEIAHAISVENVRALQNIKGIGAKTAQRMIIELKDKMIKVQAVGQNLLPEYNTSTDEALSALLMLGFQKSQVEKALSQITRDNKGLSVEGLIKMALKVL